MSILEQHWSWQQHTMHVYAKYMENRLFTIWHHLLWHRVWCHVLYYVALKVKPIWLIQFKMWGFAFWFFEIYALKWKFDQIQGFVSTLLTYMHKSTSHWAFIWYLSLVVSLELEPLRQGVVNCQFLCLYRSDMVFLLCRPSQDPVLQRSGHVLVLDCISCGLKLLKVRAMSGW